MALVAADEYGVLAWTFDISVNDRYQLYNARSSLIDELRMDFIGLYLVDDLALNQACTGIARSGLSRPS